MMLNSFYIELIYCVSRLGKYLYKKNIRYMKVSCPNDKENSYVYEYLCHADLFGIRSTNKAKVSFRRNLC